MFGHLAMPWPKQLFINLMLAAMIWTIKEELFLINNRHSLYHKCAGNCSGFSVLHYTREMANKNGEEKRKKKKKKQKVIQTTKQKTTKKNNKRDKKM